MRPSVLPLAVLLITCAACSSSSSSTAAAGGPPDASSDAEGAVLGGYDPTPFGGSRPVQVYVPSKYSPRTPAPLVILLHGYSASGAEEELYLDLHTVAEADTVLYAHPDGTTDGAGNRFWNATDACCNFGGSTVNDSAYLASLVAEIGARYTVDPKRVYFVGHSNGGFMSYRMACDHADLVAGIVSLAGAMWLDPGKCGASGPVSVLEVHGTADPTISYDGGTTRAADGGGSGGGQYPGAKTSVADWATIDGCKAPPDTSLPNLSLESVPPGGETSVTQYKAGCQRSSEADLWSIAGAGHIPAFNASFGPLIFKFLLAHPKP